jgi:hypothetical protein
MCQKCKSKRILSVSAKCADLCWVRYPNGTESRDYVPDIPNISTPEGGGDYVEFDLCLDCGQVQGKWPVKTLPKEKE